MKKLLLFIAALGLGTAVSFAQTAPATTVKKDTKTVTASAKKQHQQQKQQLKLLPQKPPRQPLKLLPKRKKIQNLLFRQPLP